jgi:sialic acid synthase SpsE
VEKTAAQGKPVIMSTGMSTVAEIRNAVNWLRVAGVPFALLHTTSTYPTKTAELNLRMIRTLEEWFPDAVIGYSGHELGLQTTLAAVALGACIVERHITLDRSMFGSDQSASVEPQGLCQLVRDIRVIEASLGDGVKRVFDSELPVLRKLRRGQSFAG